MDAMNGVITITSKCIGCGESFEDYYLAESHPDPLPVCPICEKTMEP